MTTKALIKRMNFGEFQFHFGNNLCGSLREIEDTGYAKFWGVNKEHYGLCENGEYHKYSLLSLKNCFRFLLGQL